MAYRVVLVESDEGVAVSCPALKGCHSQGATRAEALDNIREAIREWLAAADAEKSIFSVTEEEVTV
jgi:predicted RNase H-like HicB family nuclease